MTGGRSSCGSDVAILDQQVIPAGNHSLPAISSLNISESSNVHIGPKFVTVTQNVKSTKKAKALPLHRYIWQWAKSLTRAEKIFCVAAIVALIVCIVLVLYFTVIVKNEESSANDVAPHDWYITRDMWLATRRENTEIDDSFNPLRLVIVAHTVSTECHNFIDCAAELRSLQTYFLNTINDDIPFNFLIGNDGRVYEGRGFNFVGSHTYGYNRCTLGLAFIGDYREGQPAFSKVTPLQEERAQLLLKKGVDLGYLHPDFDVLGAKDVQITFSPGTNLYNAIQQWPSYDHKNLYRDKTCEEIRQMFNNETTSTTTVPTTSVTPGTWYITRDMWLGTKYENDMIDDSFNPLRLVIVAHTVSTECHNFADCVVELRTLQSFFLTSLGYDIPFNFLIGNDGRVYEGRGFNIVGAHTFGYNRCTLGLAFIGDYREEESAHSKVTPLQEQRAHMLFEKGVELGYLHPDFDVLGAKDVQTSLSPGSNLYKAIQQWPNYDHKNLYRNKTCEEIQEMFEIETTTSTTTVPTTSATPHDWYKTRDMWLATRYENDIIDDSFNPLRLVIVAHTATAECHNFDDCAEALRNLQSYFLNSLGYDIAFNFLIGNDGRVYEGRGFNIVGAHTFGYNRCTLGLAFVGDYREEQSPHSKVTPLQEEGAHMLFEKGVELGFLHPDFDVLGAIDVQATLSPGSNLYKAIQQWPNYDHKNLYRNKTCEEIQQMFKNGIVTGHTVSNTSVSFT